MKYAVVDLEMCKVPKGYKKFGYKWCLETIQIGAVLLEENYNKMYSENVGYILKKIYKGYVARNGDVVFL